MQLFMFFLLMVANPYLHLRIIGSKNKWISIFFKANISKTIPLATKNHAVVHIYIIHRRSTLFSVYLPAWLFLLHGRPTPLVGILLFACFSLCSLSMTSISHGWCTASLRWTFHNNLHSSLSSSSKSSGMGKSLEGEGPQSLKSSNIFCFPARKPS